MTDFNFDPQVGWAVGQTITVYRSSGGIAFGPAVTTGTVSANGTTAVTGLSDNEHYVATNGSRVVAFATLTDPTTGGGGGGDTHPFPIGYTTGLQAGLDSKPTAALDTDGTLAANSDTRVPSQKAVKTYVDAHAGGGAVVKDYLYLDHPSIGVDYTSTANQAAKVQAALDAVAAAGGGTVFVGGKVRMGNTSIAWPTLGSGRGSVRLLGSGSSDSFSEAACGLYWDADTASSAPLPGDHANTTFGIRVSASSLPWKIEKLNLQGPGGTAVIGTLPAKMYGIFVPTRGVMQDVTIKGFGAAVGLINDHQVFRDCDWRGNGYAIDFMDNHDGGLGDLLFDRIFMIDQACAGIAISDSNCIANARFTQGHSGAAPFGIYRYAGQQAPRGQAMQNVVFENWSFEYCGNAVIYDEPGDAAWAGIVFDSPAEVGTGGSAKWPGKPWPMAKFHIGTGDGFDWRDGYMIPQPDVPDTPLIAARDFYRFNMGDARNLADGILTYGHKSFVSRNGSFGAKYVGGQLGQRGVGPGSLVLGAIEADGTIRKGALVEAYGTNFVRESRNNAQSEVLGVSLIDYTGRAEAFATVTSGSQTVTVTSALGGTFRVGAFVGGAGIPKDAKITAVAGSVLTISAAATASGTGVYVLMPGDVCVFAAYGNRNLLTVINNSGSTIAKDALLTPDSAHQGSVRAATSMADGPIIGRAHDTSIANGDLGPVMLRL